MVKKLQWSISHGGLYLEAAGRRGVVRVQCNTVTEAEGLKKLLAQIEDLVDNPFLGDQYAVTYIEGETLRFSVGEKTETEEVSLIVNVKTSEGEISLSLLPTILLNKVNELNRLFKGVTGLKESIKGEITSSFSGLEIIAFLLNGIVDLDANQPLRQTYRLGFTLRKEKLIVSALFERRNSPEELVEAVKLTGSLVDSEEVLTLWNEGINKSLLVHFEDRKDILGVGLYAIGGENFLVANEFDLEKETMAGDALKERLKQETIKLKEQVKALSL